MESDQSREISTLNPHAANVPTSPIPPKSSKLPIILLSLLSLALFSGMIYFYLQTQSIKKQLQSSNQSLEQSTFSPKPDSQQILTDNYQGEAGPQLLTYHDDICNVDISFPQLTEIDGKRFYWKVDASKTRTFVMDERSAMQKEPDQSIVIYTQPEGNKMPYYSSSVMIVCGQNTQNLSLEKYLEKTLIAQDWGGETKYSIGNPSKFGNTTLTELVPSEGRSIYRGIYKNNLIMVSNSSSYGDLQPIANTILNSISFK